MDCYDAVCGGVVGAAAWMLWSMSMCGDVLSLPDRDRAGVR